MPQQKCIFHGQVKRVQTLGPCELVPADLVCSPLVGAYAGSSAPTESSRLKKKWGCAQKG